MRVPDKNGDILVFVSGLISVAFNVKGDISSDKAVIINRIEDCEGMDITHLTRFKSVNENEHGNRWIDVECPALNILGPFSAYPRLT